MDQNLSDALKIAGALLFFVGALTLAIMSLSNTRNGAVGVIESYSETIEFYDNQLFSNIAKTSQSGSYTRYKTANNNNSFKIESERVVGMESILPNVFDYYDSGYTILFYYLDGKVVKPLPLYRSQARIANLYYSKLRIIERRRWNTREEW